VIADDITICPRFTGRNSPTAAARILLEEGLLPWPAMSRAPMSARFASKRAEEAFGQRRMARADGWRIAGVGGDEPRNVGDLAACPSVEPEPSEETRAREAPTTARRAPAPAKKHQRGTCSQPPAEAEAPAPSGIPVPRDRSQRRLFRRI
jgi:hypothetical protein